MSEMMEAGFIVNREEGNISPKSFKVLYDRFFKTAKGKEIVEFMQML